MKSIEEKAELWDYYQDLVKYMGFDNITDLLAENKRLQAIIDAIKSIWWKSKSSHVMRTDTAKEIINTVLSSSPRITDHDDTDNAEVYETLYTDAKHWFAQHIESGELPPSVIDSVQHLFEHWLATKEGRITEQDALEIAENHYKYRRNKAANNIGSGFSDWFTDEGRELLAKLNDQR